MKRKQEPQPKDSFDERGGIPTVNTRSQGVVTRVGGRNLYLATDDSVWEEDPWDGWKMIAGPPKSTLSKPYDPDWGVKW